MNELKRVREQAANEVSTNCIPCRVMHNGCPSRNKKTRTIDYPCKHQLEIADQILSLKGIRIECDDQSLPEPSLENASYENASKNIYCWVQRACFKLAHEDMLKPDSEGNHWVKVGPKEK